MKLNIKMIDLEEIKTAEHKRWGKGESHVFQKDT